MNVSYQVPGRVPEDGTRELVSRYWRERFNGEPYYTDGELFEDYEPAYLAGHEARIRGSERAYDEIEPELHRNWDAQRGPRSLSWSKARHAVRRGWESAREIAGQDGRR
ncbi:hypothetical protein [[Pseudomonas] boreopolis]|uniref:Uncharacterized protein n=1 Tax=Xanthomonas boreopolis TaxID=86183 RepID=A0A919KIL9_9XANT|nr:hypothetical protein GCM10009090_24680 [[Pseudomonas] boreopolis]